MKESYYERELSLIKRERHLRRKMDKEPTKRNCDTWARASRRLVAHENSFRI